MKVVLGLVAAVMMAVVLAAPAQAAPFNDNFSSADVLSSELPTGDFTSNFGATKEAGEPNHAGNAGGASVWYSWTPSSSGKVDISACGEFTDTLLAVYTGSAVNGLTEVASNDNAPGGCNSTASDVQFTATAGTTYRIAVDGKGGAQGSFELDLQGEPANDAFAAAASIDPGLPESAYGSNKLATKQVGEPDHAGNAGGASLWYSWTPSSSGKVDISTCAYNDLDPLLAVYTGSAVNGLTLVASSDDSPGGCEADDSDVQIDVTAGTTYKIAVDGKDGTRGSFSLELTGPPQNDSFASASPVGGLPDFIYGSNKLATKQVGEPDHAGNAGGSSVWYSVTPASSGKIEISACGSDIDTLLAVYTGAAVNGLTLVASNDDSSSCFGGGGSDVIFNATAGTTYFVALDGKGGAQGYFELDFIGPPANDDFADAEPISSFMPNSAFVSNRLATKQGGEPNHAGNAGGASVWYTWTPSSSGPVSIYTCAYGVDPLLAVYTGSAVNGLTEVASNDNAPGGCNSTDSEVQFNATAGTTYKIAVDAKGANGGSFSLSLTGPPANDSFSSPQTISGSLPAFASGSNKMGSKQGGEPSHAGKAGGASVWYSWTPASSGKVDISTCSYSSSIDTLLAVYTGSAVNGLTPVASNDDSSLGCSGTNSDVQFNAVAGTNYRIAVDGANGTTGSFELNLKGPPSNDDFANAQMLSAGLPTSVSSGTNRAAGKQGGEPNHAGNAGGASVWYSWTPTASSRVEVSTCSLFSSRADSLLAVYTGSAVNGLTPVASNDDRPNSLSGCASTDSRLQFDAVAGTTYRIAVDGRGGGQGSFSLSLLGPPANDDFAAAQALSSTLPVTAAGNNKLATKQGGEPSHAADPGGASVWYSWTASASVPIAISTCSSESGIDSVLGVYTGSALNSLTPVASNDDRVGSSCSDGDSEVRFTAVAGTTYRIAVDGAGGSEGYFGLEIAGRPANDDFAKARTLSGTMPIFTEASNVLATKQGGEPSHAGNAGGASVWFSWTASSGGQIDISTCAYGDVDSLLAVYTGSAVNGLTEVASNDDSPLGCNSGDSDVQFTAVAGTTYRIAVDGKGGEEGEFSLRLSGRPANDDFASAQALSSNFGVFANGSNKLASKQGGEPSHAGSAGGHSVWYSWTPSSSGTAEISLCAYGGFDSLLAVYTGSAVNGLTPVASNDDAGSGCSAGSRLQFGASAGTTYMIAVDGKDGGQGTFEMYLSQAVPASGGNDDFAGAQVLSGTLPAFAYGNNTAATKQGSEPNHAGNAGGASVWYSWTPSSSGKVDISTCVYEDDLDTLLAVYTGSAVNGLTEVASNDNAPGGCSSTDSDVQFTATAGTTYRIAVDGKGATRGFFELDLIGPPANDDFVNAQAVGGSLPRTLFGSTALATKQGGEPNHAGNAGGASVWYSWTPSSSGQAYIATCSSIDTLLAVYTGSAVNGLTPVASNDDSPGSSCDPTNSGLQLTVTAGTTYTVAVDGKNGATGSFVLEFLGTPGNDDFSHAVSLGSGLSKETYGHNFVATKQGGEPNHAGNAGGASVWFKWTASSNSTVSVDTCGSDFDTLLAVYTGSAVNGLTPVASNDNGGGSCAPQSKLTFSATAGTTYRIAVDGKAGAQGNLVLDIFGRPANDDFAAATTIGSALPRYAYGSSRLATKEGGEPNHAGNAGGHSVWYSWTSPVTGPVTFNTCYTGFDSLLAVYTGSAVNGLTPVASNDDGGGECAPGSELTFNAVNGTTYKIAVDGANGDDGEINLELEAGSTVPQRTLTVSKTGSGGGTVSSSPAGIDCGSTCSYSFDENTVVTLTPSPDSNSTFGGWSGACSGTGVCQVTMDQARSVAATFLARRTLTISKGGTGGGVVTSLPAGIDCGSTCSASFTEGTVVTVSGAPDGSSTFTGWSGGGCSGSGSCQVTLTADTTVTATFAQNAANERTLTVAKSGTGTGTVSSSPAGIDCGAACSHAFTAGTPVTLTPSAGANSVFGGWSGACSGTGVCQVTMDQARSVGAKFDLVQRTLTVAKGGTGGGTVTSAPAGISCGATCSAKFAHGTAVTLTAAPASGSTFSGWSGGGCSGTGSCQVTLGADAAVTASFATQPAGTGGGSGGGSPPSSSGGGATTLPGPASTPAAPKPLTCKKGFKKKKVGGKVKCVKAAKKKKRRH